MAKKRKGLLIPLEPLGHGQEDIDEIPLDKKGFIMIDKTYQDRIGGDPSTWIVYCQLIAHADKKGHCWPSIRRLARLCGIHNTTVQKAITRLQDIGLITIQKKTGKATHYWVRHTPHKLYGTRQRSVRKEATEQETINNTHPPIFTPFLNADGWGRSRLN